MQTEVLNIRAKKSQSNVGVSESFKSLRTNLMYTEGAKVITVTSTVPNEGKTVTAFNMAESFAMMDKRVLLIDCDLRKGSMKRFFALKSSVKGMSELLSEQAGDVCHPTSNINLDVILSGKCPPNPSELLSSELFETVLTHLRNQYDYIIIDTPPMTASMDATITGRISDGVVIVVRNDFVKKKIVKRIKTQLERNGSRILGVVLNRVKKDQVDYQSYGYEYYGESSK